MNGIAEQVAGPTPELDVRYKSLWLEQVRAAGATERQIADSLYRQREDRCAPVEDQLVWMRAAGFADADCWLKRQPVRGDGGHTAGLTLRPVVVGFVLDAQSVQGSV